MIVTSHDSINENYKKLKDTKENLTHIKITSKI